MYTYRYDIETNGLIILTFWIGLNADADLFHVDPSILF